MKDNDWLVSVIMWVYYLAAWIVVLYLIYRVYTWASGIL